MRHYPHLYEINSRPYLQRLSKKYNRRLTLGTIPDEEWQELSRQGFDLVWLMGVWQRSPAARQIALTETSLRNEYSKVLPDWTIADIAGSPYAIYDYSLDSTLGEASDLVKLRANLNRHGLGLILDFVPNHLATDHPWVLSYPGRFVHGSREDNKAHPDWFFSPAPDIFVAHGRDPYFPPWSDTAQVNIYATALRQAFIGQILRIGEIADGVRCDMAMLALNDVFEQVWGSVIRSYPRPETEFWTEAITSARQRRPDFLFLGEVYWSLEKELHQLGFDFTYDKNLYDRLLYATPSEVLQQLTIDGLYQPRMARFIENHDEPRSLVAFGKEKSLAAATIIMTLPGLRFIHDGQMEGRTIRLPVQLVREPAEPVDIEVKAFYERLIAAANQPVFHDGEWRIVEVKSSAGRPHQQVLAWSWQLNQELKLVIINYAAKEAQAYLKLDIPPERQQNFQDMLTSQTPNISLTETSIQFTLNSYQASILSI